MDGAAEAATDAAEAETWEATGVLEVDARADEAEDMAADIEVIEVMEEAMEVAAMPEAEVVPLRVAEVPDPVVVMAPVVSMPEVEALALRHESDDPGWITRSDDPVERPVESVIKRVTDVPAARSTIQVYGLEVSEVERVDKAGADG